MRGLIASLLLVALAGCTSDPPAMPGGEARPPMWVIHDADTRIVILGSVHQLPAGLDWTGGRLATEIRLADELLLELGPEESAAAGRLFASLARDEPVPTVTERFGRDATAILDLLDDVGMAQAEADRTESWGLALAVGNALARQTSLSPERGVESVLTAAFRGHDRPVRGLETAAQQLAMFDDLPSAQQAAMVRTTLDDVGASRDRTRRLLAAWASGDVAAIAEVADATMAETPFLIEPVNHARNRAWAAALIARLETRGDVLVAVGVGHLVGDGSLLDELRARGLRPMRLQ